MSHDGIDDDMIDDDMIDAALRGADARPAGREAVHDDRERRRRQDVLHRTVAALDSLLESAPPPALRANVLEVAARRRPQLIEPAPVHELYTNQVSALTELLHALEPHDWTRAVEPYDWNVHGLVAHLLVIEEYTAGRFGLAPGDQSDLHHLALGADRIARELTGPPHRTAAAWIERAKATAAALRDRSIELPAEVTLHGWPFTPDGAVIARAFEIWTHADDIRRATGRLLWTPTPEDLRAMSCFSVRALPLTLGLVAPDVPLTPTRIVLTGSGGGTFDLGDGDDTPKTTLVIDAVDYCRVVARRIARDDLECTIDGDPRLAEALLAGASVFAV